MAMSPTELRDLYENSEAVKQRRAEAAVREAEQLAREDRLVETYYAELVSLAEGAAKRGEPSVCTAVDNTTVRDRVLVKLRKSGYDVWEEDKYDMFDSRTPHIVLSVAARKHGLDYRYTIPRDDPEGY